jgi:hypothetical protein
MDKVRNAEKAPLGLSVPIIAGCRIFRSSQTNNYSISIEPRTFARHSKIPRLTTVRIISANDDFTRD